MGSKRDTGLDRRTFMAALAGAGAAGLQMGCGLFDGDGGLASIVAVDNPLAAYPNRDWESVYRDQYRYDRSFTWVCAPERHPHVPHAGLCAQRRDRAHGTELRHAALWRPLREPLRPCNGTRAAAPRATPFIAAIYGPYRLKGPVVRKGWKEWADAGFPSLERRSSAAHAVQVSTIAATTRSCPFPGRKLSRYVARGLMAIGQDLQRRRRAHGDSRSRRLRRAGDASKPGREAGTRTMKIGSCLPLHGLVGKFGIFRFANHDGPGRPSRTWRRPRRGQGRPRLDRVHVARRPGARNSPLPPVCRRPTWT